ncbi:MAG: ECF transporter S component [Oscillospiraceae bacterium]
MSEKSRNILQYIILLGCIPAVILLGALLFNGKQYAWVSLCITILACVPFFMMFEKGKSGTKQMIIIAVMVAITVIGRIIFSAIPGFKPVTALVVITAMYFGSQAGFMTGALSAIISDFYFGQGAWTPFQMFVWGLIGLLAGLFAKHLKKSSILLIIFGVFSGIIFSILMDVWTVLWWDGTFNFQRYIAAIISAAPFTLIYAISNVVFLILLNKPIGSKLERIKDKYGL